MNRILQIENIAPMVFRAVIGAPEIARKRKAGQFIVLRVSELGERIPLTIADADPQGGTITLVFQEVGRSTAELARKKVGDSIPDLIGPLGKPTHIEKFGTVVCIGGGIGTAPIHPIAQAMKAAGNTVISILGARTKNLIIMEEEMRHASDRVIVVTDDGSYGEKAFVTQALQKLIDAGEKIDVVVAIGPAIMMKMVCKVTEPYKLLTLVSLNTIMVDGTGMCGGCRITYDGKAKFVCVDGPEFDGHKVDFDEMMKRLSIYRDAEQEAYRKFKQDHQCAIGLGQ